MMKYLPLAVGFVLFAGFFVVMGTRLGQDELQLKDTLTLVTAISSHLADVEAKVKALEEKPAKKGDKK